MPPQDQTGMAFVLVQHLSPDHKSVLVDVVKRYTRMQVFDNNLILRPALAAGGKRYKTWRIYDLEL